MPVEVTLSQNFGFVVELKVAHLMERQYWINIRFCKLVMKLLHLIISRVKAEDFAPVLLREKTG